MQRMNQSGDLMANQTTMTTSDWRELEQRALSLVPDDVFDHIPMRFAEGKKTIRFHGSRISLYVIVTMYKSRDSLNTLCTGFPQLKREDIRSVIDYYDGPHGDWIDEYIDLLDYASISWIDDFHRRCDAGEFPSIKPRTERAAGSGH